MPVVLLKMKAMRKIYLALMLSAASLAAAAQGGKGSVSVNITNEQKAPLESATVEILRAKDSVLVKTALSDRGGTALAEALPAGRYLLRITMTGHEPRYAPAFEVTEGAVQLPAIALSARSANELKGVTVTARKPFIQKLNDRIVVNVENSIVSAGSTAMDVLERAPGVTIDNNDALSLRGRAGVIIMIDGKPSPMTGADLANYLRGLNSNAIERIDIITNPSSKYDAAGNSGIIDIRLKKDQRLGTNGTLTAGYGRGILPKANAGATINHRNKNMNLFGSYNYGNREFLNHLFINRNFYSGPTLTASDDKDNYSETQVQSHAVRAGADFFLTKKSTLGFLVNGNMADIDRRGDILTNVHTTPVRPGYYFTTIATNDDYNNNVVGNINFKTRLDSAGSELTADADLGIYRSGSLTRTGSSYFNSDGSEKRSPDILDGDQKGRLSLATAKADYTHPIGKNARLEAGAKTSYVRSDNDARFYNVSGAVSSVDSTKTNRFYYEEYNNAVYVNGSKDWSKWSLQLGLRGEQTNIRTLQTKTGARFRNDYFQLFPSAFVTYKLKEDKAIGLSVSRRIDRPGYSQLNPFLFQIDATIYATGAPLLRPQLTWSYEASYTVKQLNFTLGYSHTTDPQTSVLSRILDVIPDFQIKPGQDSNITVQIPVNLESSDYFGLTATLPWRVKPWWNLMANVNVFYNHFNGNIGGALLSNGDPAANLRLNNTFTLPKGWGAELNASYNSVSRYNYAKTATQWGISAGVQKNVLAGKGTVRLNVTDIFFTNLPRATVTYEGNYIENWHAIRDSRVATLSFTYRFGSSKVQAARRRTTASEEERQRAGG
ncbi:MAG: TonB-dependent receptor [Chitinophagaceae bacterium]|nr:MAG: TonB-dependent receptor [Chitinophagaceae bacterium]